MTYGRFGIRSIRAIIALEIDRDAGGWAMPQGTVTLEHLIEATTAFVDPWAIHDLAPTGLQVRGAPEGVRVDVNRVALAVSTTAAVIDSAAEWGAQLLVAHHGMFWGTTRPTYDAATDPARPWDLRRLERLLSHGLSLAAYHLPLDAHAEIGNNAELARRLGLTVVASDLGGWPGTTAPLGLRATTAEPLNADELGRRVARAFDADPIVIPGKPGGIRTIGIMSGGATREIHEIIDLGLDAYLSGEGEVWSYDLALEAGVTIVVMGHHRSERYGVQALGGWLGRRFGLETRFFDEPNPF